ncbi:MAG: winged helix-turn-helix domain-containing protein, partial [Thermofilum sp.]
MKEYIIAILLLALAATGTLLSLQTLTQKATATPTGLIVTSPTTSLVKTETRNNTHIYTLQIHVKPLSSLQAEKIGCIYGAKVTTLNTSVGKATLEKNPDSACIFFTIDNPSIRDAEATVLVTAETLLEEKGEPPILLIGILAGIAAASYLTQTESGRDKLFKAISIPVGYYVARHEDVLRSKKRVEILEYLKKEPGSSMRRISRDTGISFGEVQWHLSILERLGYVRRASARALYVEQKNYDVTVTETCYAGNLPTPQTITDTTRPVAGSWLAWIGFRNQVTCEPVPARDDYL